MNAGKVPALASSVTSDTTLGPFMFGLVLDPSAGRYAKAIMERCLVRRDQFNISPQGIVHKPTDAAFTPYPGDPFSGILRMGRLGNKHPDGADFNSDDVERIMKELWAEYVAGNPQLFRT
jgi:hypothetical protein